MDYQTIGGLDAEYIETLKDRFWAKVERRPGDACWKWAASRNKAGYGHFGVMGKPIQLAHRVSYEINVGPIPAGLLVLHLCDNPPCVRPAHLFTGTYKENLLDAIEKGRHTPTRRKLENKVVVFWRERFDPDRHSTTEIAAQLGVNQVTVANFLTGVTYRDLPGRRHDRLTNYFISEDDKQKAIRLYQAGVAPADILPVVEMAESSFYRIVNETA